MPRNEEPICSEQAIAVARAGLQGIGNGIVEDLRLEGDPPVWVLTARVENASESPYLASMTIASRRQITVDAISGQVRSRAYVGNPEYIPDPWRPGPFFSQVWRHSIVGGGKEHEVLIYSVQISPYDRLWFGWLRLPSRIAYEVLVDGEWASPDGYRCYDGYEDALAAAREAVEEQ